MVGTGSVDLWLQADTDDVDVQVTLTEVRPDGNETLVQSGWQRASQRALSDQATLLRPLHTNTEADVAPLPGGEWSEAQVELFPFGTRSARVRRSASSSTRPVRAGPDGSSTCSTNRRAPRCASRTAATTRRASCSRRQRRHRSRPASRRARRCAVSPAGRSPRSDGRLAQNATKFVWPNVREVARREPRTRERPQPVADHEANARSASGTTTAATRRPHWHRCPSPELSPMPGSTGIGFSSGVAGGLHGGMRHPTALGDRVGRGVDVKPTRPSNGCGSYALTGIAASPARRPPQERVVIPFGARVRVRAASPARPRAGFAGSLTSKSATCVPSCRPSSVAS